MWKYIIKVLSEIIWEKISFDRDWILGLSQSQVFKSAEFERAPRFDSACNVKKINHIL